MASLIRARLARTPTPCLTISWSFVIIILSCSKTLTIDYCRHSLVWIGSLRCYPLISHRLSFDWDSKERKKSTFYVLLVYVALLSSARWKRKTTVCGAETKRWADHMANAHPLLDHKQEKVSRIIYWPLSTMSVILTLSKSDASL